MTTSKSVSADQIRMIADLQDSLGMPLSAYRPEQLWSRVEAFLNLRHLDWAGLGARLRRDQLFVRDLQHYLTIHVTSFYRDPSCWRALEQLVRGAPQRPIWQVWCAGVSTGAEAVSAVGLFQQSGLEVQILGTDVDGVALEEARAGVYDASMCAGMEADVRERLLAPLADGLHAVRPDVRRRIVYRRLDLLADPYPDRQFDLILCRNVLIYFGRQDRLRVIGAIVDHVSRGGLLFLSATEVVLSPEGYGLVRMGPALYQKI